MLPSPEQYPGQPYLYICMFESTYWLLDGPVRELLCVTEMSEVEDITEELILQLRILDHWHCTVLHGEHVIHI